MNLLRLNLALLLSIIFLYSMPAHSEDERVVPARFNAEKLSAATLEFIGEKVSICGQRILFPFHVEARDCDTGRRYKDDPKNQCFYEATKGFNVVPTELGDNKTRWNLSFNIREKFRRHYTGFPGHYAELIENATSSAAEPSQLEYSFTLYDRQKDGKIDHYYDAAKLYSGSHFPVLSLVSEKAVNCQIDQWGRKNCSVTKNNFSKAYWILGYRYSPVTKWYNSKTQTATSFTSNFGDYMKCVEGIVNNGYHPVNYSQ